MGGHTDDSADSDHPRSANSCEDYRVGFLDPGFDRLKRLIALQIY